MANTLQIAQLGHPILRTPAKPIENLNDDTVQNLIDDMFLTVEGMGGMGLAAPQVYHSKQLLIMSSKPNSRYPEAPDMKPLVLINPKIVWQSDEIEKGWEGCLSVPGIRGLVPRSTEINVTYVSRAGEAVDVVFSSFLARVFLHEYDHLIGKVFIDRVESSLDLMAEKEWLKRY